MLKTKKYHINMNLNVAVIKKKLITLAHHIKSIKPITLPRNVTITAQL